ncbi:acetoacetate-CoA ligase [Leptospira ryugenii]|uniref:Acetoacetate-CoA ligase n=2 Tax=Leptospira ryugenii TaxID=1917863 RepID=A0A2P2E288_9LEPT|nr:acetoacetate-CoA ligase [Leptospira ryugenii]
MDIQKSIEAKEKISFASYEAFHTWSVDHIELFWKYFADFAQVRWRKKGTEVLSHSNTFWNHQWFPGSQINFAENLLERGNSQSVAIHFRREDGVSQSLTYAELKQMVMNVSSLFKQLGVQKGDRVCGLVPNSPIATIAMLAATSLGAVWSSASPDFGAKGILDRFEQIEPKVMITIDEYLFKGKRISILDKVVEVSQRLSSRGKNYKATIISSFLGERIDVNGIALPLLWEEIPQSSDALAYEPIYFSDPVYIMFSSGTTGLPKCIVQGPGVLLNQMKELMLHCDIKSRDRFFYYTTCGWMMWNWSQAVLSLGATLYQFDGNPFHETWRDLWAWLDQEQVNIFGTSAKYLSVLEGEKAKPKSEFSLSSLRLLLSTGSPLFASGFRYVYDSIKADLHLASISGGTDLNGCFVLGNPNLAVYEGEIQCAGLAMDVQIYSESGEAISSEKGELVCRRPFPSMPLYFWNDPDSSKYKQAYFDRFTNIWCHGDFAEKTNQGGYIIYGRSDATLNPGGVRIGTADIYSVLETIPEVKDSVIIGQDWNDDVRVVLFVKLVHPNILDEALKRKIQTLIRDQTSPRHVPQIILEVPDVPYTINGKKVELAVKQIVQGIEVKNRNALANPECLVHFANRLELQK